MGRVGLGQGARALSQRETRSQGQGKTENLEGSLGLNAGRRENSPDTGEVIAGDAVRVGAKNKHQQVRIMCSWCRRSRARVRSSPGMQDCSQGWQWPMAG